MSVRQRVSAVLFDLDGTLVDSLEDIHDALNRALEAHGLPASALTKTRSLIGHGSHHLVRGAVGDQGPVEVVRDRFLAEYSSRLTHKTRAYPGVVPFLHAMKNAGIATGVATNKPGLLARALLDELGLSALFGAVSGGDEAPRKPEPHLLHLTLRRLGIPSPPEDGAVVYVGDMPVDVQAAKVAGCRFMGAGWGFGADRSQGEEWFDQPEDLLSALALDARTVAGKNEGG